MEFCPMCKSFMVPKNSGKKTILVCKRCGNEIKKFRAEKYKISENARLKRGDILVVEGVKKQDSEESRRYFEDLYGREVYEIEE